MPKRSAIGRVPLPSVPCKDSGGVQERAIRPLGGKTDSCPGHSRHRRVRPRPKGSARNGGCATVTAAVALSGIFSSFLQSVACTTVGNVRVVRNGAATAFMAAATSRRRLFPSTSVAVNLFNKGSCVGSSAPRTHTPSAPPSNTIGTTIFGRGIATQHNKSSRRVHALHRGSELYISSSDYNSSTQQDSPVAVPQPAADSPTSKSLSRVRPPPPETLLALPSSAKGAAGTRLEFLRHGSVAAALVVGTAASSTLLSPNQPAAAAVPASATGVQAATATAGTSSSSGGPAVGADMVWLDEDSGTVSSKLSQADETYGQGFVAYLARFLLNYDEGCREYFNGELDVVVPKRDGSHIWEQFRGFAASVGVGLIKFPGAAGAHQLAVSLEGKYASGQRDGSAQQLAVLFSLLPPEIQPVSLVKSLLAYPTVNTSVLNGVKAEVLDLPSILGESPSVLLPAEVRPRYDEVVKAFFIPGVSQQFKENGMELAFGARGPFPISKERSLTAVDFALFAACGAVGCTSTHSTVIPLDVVKTRLQTDPGRYKGLAEGVTTIAKEEGWPMLLQGLGPTIAGYFWYGITVYPGYELFKRLFIELVGPLNAALFRVPLVLAAGASATCFACIGVCPAEAVRIRQVADPSVGSMPSAIKQIVAESGWGRLYDGLPSILFRQISFGMMKFLVFDYFNDFAYGMMPFLAEQTSTRLSVSLASGLVAGVCAAIVSQPADTVLSTMNRCSGRATIPGTIQAIVGERGVGGLFLGLQSRIVWSGAIISGQFLLYDVCKTALHVSTDDLRVFLDVIASAGL